VVGEHAAGDAGAPARVGVEGPVAGVEEPAEPLRPLVQTGARPDGNRWRRDGLRDAAAFVQEMWSDNLARFKVAAEREARSR
jgi:hypothetical protein